MNLKKIFDLFENYIEKNCECFFKGAKDPIFVQKENTKPYFMCKGNPDLKSFANDVCKNDFIKNSISLLKFYEISKFFNFK